jgi:uncharacterized protein
LKIIVSKIPEGGRDLRFEKDWKWFQDLLPETERPDYVLDGITVTCTVRRVKETVYLEGSVTATAEAPCSRCLITTRFPVSAPFKYTFAPQPARLQEETELSAEDLDFAYYQEDTIDLDMVIFEQLLLQIPIKPLCAEFCKGLCPHCGINRNAADCHCQTRPFDERLAVLKQFKIQTDNP